VRHLPHCFCLLRTETGGKVRARVLEARIQPPLEFGHGLPLDRLSGIPRLRNCTFTGAYPFAHLALSDPDVPVQVTLEAFNPLVPGDPDASGIPVAVLRYHVHNPKRARVKASLAFSVHNPVGPAEGRRNVVRRKGRVRAVLVGNPKVAASDPAAGTLCLAVEGAGAAALPCWPAPYPIERLNAQALWRNFKDNGRPDAPPKGKEDYGKAIVSATLSLGPGETKAVTFYLAWHFPNRTPAACGWASCEGRENTIVGNYYTTQYRDAWDVVAKTTPSLRRLERETRAFTRSVLESDLPPVAIEAALNNVSTLRTTTCFRTADGRFYGFEGCNDSSGCCFGSCTHVWNYEQTTAYLFPSLARSMRETEFAVSTDKDGFMCFRTMLPAGKCSWRSAAADGQMGCLMKLYRDWKLCGDTAWLRGLWPKARRSLEFCWAKGGWDADKDGVMEGAQHTTYDSELYGPNPLCQVWYLGALRSAEEMARAVGQEKFADEVRALFEKGSRWTDEHLFNGAYYEQKIRAADQKEVADGLRLVWAGIDPSKPTNQVGDGCLVDQLLGQYFAHVVGLGYLLKPANVKKAARAIFRNNHVSMAEHECLGRSFAMNDEQGLVICSWPNSPENQMVHWFFTEFMTGFEYAAGVLMLQEGLMKEGLTVVRDIRERYDGRKRNPWNEAECGHHYARAMAAWAALLTLSGFQYSALEREVQFLPPEGVLRGRATAGLSSRASHGPRRQGVFRCFWSAGGAWGTVALDTKARRAELRVLHGKLKLKALRLPSALAGGKSVKLDGKRVKCSVEQDGNAAVIRLARTRTLSSGSMLALA